MTYAKDHSAYGGELQKKRDGRRGPRPLSSTHTMHVVLRAARHNGTMPFAKGSKSGRAEKILHKFVAKNKVELRRLAVNGNHIHIHARFPSAQSYKRFIRAVTGAIAHALGHRATRFWHYRPFSRVVKGERGARIVDNYVHVNEWEAKGYPRHIARFLATMWGLPPREK